MVAAEPVLCGNPSGAVELVTLGPSPTVDGASVTLDIDAGQLSLQGRGLNGSTLVWSSGEKRGSDVCNEPMVVAGVDLCTFAAARGLPADPSLVSVTLLSAGSRIGPAVYTDDSLGLLVRPES